MLLTTYSILGLHAQIGAYLGFASFNTPNNQPYLETYLTFSGSFYKQKKIKGAFQSSVNIQLKIFKDTSLVKAMKYNLSGPVFYDSLKAPSFIDNQRFSLPNGVYKLKMELSDNFDLHSKKQSIESKIIIDYKNDSIQLSDVELIERYQKSTQQSLLTKSGIDIVPYSINYYPESNNELSFYIEAYNISKKLGTDKNFIFYYYLETEDGKTQLNNFGSFKKQLSAEVNPLLAKINIKNLGSGSYNLVVVVKDELNQIKAIKKTFIQRLNRKLDMVSIQKNYSLQETHNYFSNCNNGDTLKMFVECLWPIADGLDKERIINQSIKKDKEMMKKFVIDFWTRRAADTANPINLWARYYKSVQQAMILFRCGKMPGYYTDRGRVYLQYGAPSQRSQQTMEQNTFPYEIWQYYRTTDAVTNDIFNNRKFVFVSKNLGDDCYSLIHSDMRGELNNPRWQFEVTRRNNNGIANPDNNTPAGIDNNHFNDLYNNPR